MSPIKRLTLRETCDVYKRGAEQLVKEREQLTLALRDLESTARDLDNALAVCDRLAQKVSDHPDGEEWVGSYYLKCGPWHRVLGCRSSLSWALTKAKTALAAVAYQPLPAEEGKP